MKRIGIHTITDYVNYGNRLQNYATQEILRQLGFEVESIVNHPTPPLEAGWEFTKKRLNNAFKQSPVVLIKKIIKKFADKRIQLVFNSCQRDKAASFKEFTNKYIKESDFVLTLDNIPADINERYDYCVVGSDQIWNPNIRYGSPLDFLSYVSAEKRIALAPSFGVSHIPEKYHKMYTAYLDEMAHLSVREEKGAEIIKKLCGRHAEVLVDPTLILKTNDWKRIATKAKNKPVRPYMVTYFIGEVSSTRLKKLKQIASDRKLDLVMLNSLHDTKRYAANPGEFIDYIRSAALVSTDSFHCIIFSIHFQRPFVVFDRDVKSAPMSSRIDTLLGKFHFEKRKMSYLEKTSRYLEIDFSHVPQIMESERAKTLNYLHKALN